MAAQRSRHANQDRVRFYVEGSPDLENFHLLLGDIPATSGEMFETVVDGEGHQMHYFRIGLGLR